MITKTKKNNNNKREIMKYFEVVKHSKIQSTEK